MQVGCLPQTRVHPPPCSLNFIPSQDKVLSIFLVKAMRVEQPEGSLLVYWSFDIVFCAHMETQMILQNLPPSPLPFAGPFSYLQLTVLLHGVSLGSWPRCHS